MIDSYLFCSFYYKINLKRGGNKRFENIISSMAKHLKKDQKIIHTLMGNDVALRKDFIVSNAINVENLDI